MPLTALADTAFVSGSIMDALLDYVDRPELQDTAAAIRSAFGDISGDNIYTANGALGSNRIVDLSGNSLNFTGGNVGIGTTAPLSKVHVYNALGDVGQSIESQSNGISFLTLAENSNTSQFFGGQIRYVGAENNLKIGAIDNNVFRSEIELNRTADGLRIPSYGDETFSANGTHAVLLAVDEADGDIVDDTNVYLRNGNVGIGESEPSSTLDVSGNASFRSTGATILAIEDSDGGFPASTLNVQNGGRDFKIEAPQDLIFETANVQRMYLLSLIHISEPTRPY